MDLRDLLSGIAVVIDDAFSDDLSEEGEEKNEIDGIFEIVKVIEQEWKLPFYRSSAMPPDQTWPNLLQAASFVLLDWKLWRSGSSLLENEGIKKNIEFLEQAKNYLVPVFIFTNESPDDVEDNLPATVYENHPEGKNFIFIQRKNDLLSGDSLNFEPIEEWIRNNASVYVLKTWERALHCAKIDLFGSMNMRSPEWPRVFWKAYCDDGVDPSSSLTHLINDSLRGRMQTNTFDDEILEAASSEITSEDLRALVSETSFRRDESLPSEEIRCGDVFQSSERRFLLNLRPDCDCIPRSGQKTDKVQLYCVEGEEMSDEDIDKRYKNGHFEERIYESIAFAAYNGRSVIFTFKSIRLKRFGEIREKRIGRLLHPYLTRIQQRYALYLQRQGLPRVPEGAIP